MEKKVRGYKVFEPDWTCRGKQYTCPGKFEENIVPSVCEKGMHFCKKAIDCFNYYRFNPENRVAEVIAYGAVAGKGNKCCTDKLEIVREIPWLELLELVNTGKGCTGSRNSGDYNSGNHNSGNCNSGDYNSGNHNSGNCNSGNCNSGNCNSGDWNACSFSNGCFNTIEPKITMFNKPTDWNYADWVNSGARVLLDSMPGDALEYIRYSDMTEDEKKLYPEAQTTGGYPKNINGYEKIRAANDWWRDLSDSDKKVVMAIPNFDAEIFRRITGIEVSAKGEQNEADS